MREQPQRSRIRIELTRRQKEQIRKATGREVSALELGLEELPEPPQPPRQAGGSRSTHSPAPEIQE